MTALTKKCSRIVCWLYLVPLWLLISGASSLDTIQLPVFDDADRDKVKIVYFTQLETPTPIPEFGPTTWNRPTHTFTDRHYDRVYKLYQDIIATLTPLEPNHKIVVNPIKIGNLANDRDIAIKACQKMGADFCLLATYVKQLGSALLIDYVEYELTDVRMGQSVRGRIDLAGKTRDQAKSELADRTKAFFSTAVPRKETQAVASSAVSPRTDRLPPEIAIVNPKLIDGILFFCEGETIDLEGYVKDDNVVDYVMVNNRPISLDQRGGFKLTTKLNIGENKFVIEAADAYKNVARREVTISRRAATFSLSVSTNPEGAEVLLDERLVGKTPLMLTDVMRGPHTVSVWKRNYREWKKRIVVDEDRELRIELEEAETESPVTESARKAGGYFAVVIGIGNYQDRRIPRLRYSTRDAQEMYEVLTDPRYGFFSKDHVRLLVDEQATYNNIKSAIGTWLRRNARKDDTVVIFFAGHGAIEDNKAYWVAYNSDIDDLYGTALSNDEVSDMFGRVEARSLIAFLDSCYSAATISRSDKKRSLVVGDPFQGFKGKGKVIITSSDGKEESLELEKFGHGVFTYYLIQGLKGQADRNKDGLIEMDEIWDYIKYRVTDAARRHGTSQTPILDGSYSAGIVLAKNAERLKELSLEAEKERRKKELEARIAKITDLFSKGELTSAQFDKAIRILQTGERNKLLEEFLSGNISLSTFKAAFR